MSENPTTDWLKVAREYLAANAAESGADVIIAGLCDEVERLRAALASIGVQQNVTLIWKISQEALNV